MKYKLFVFAPQDEKAISKIIEAASEAGAGIIGNYSQCAFITKGEGHWKSEPGSNPTIGKVGEVTRIKEVKIEMECPAEKAKEVKRAIQQAHPYEEAEVDFVELVEILG
jgi:hypothetical protein